LQAESVKVRFPEGREIPVPIAEFADFKDAILRGEAWKEVQKEAPAETFVRRAALPFKPLASSRIAISPRAPRPSATETQPAENAKDPAKDVKNSKKFKPEKISIEEHIAVRVGEKPLASPGAGAEAAKETVLAKKRPRRRRGGGTPGSVPASGEKQNTQAAKEASPAKASPAPLRKERPRSAQPADEAQKAAQKNVQGAHNRHRPRPRNTERGGD
jgi:hypothetical protein